MHGCELHSAHNALEVLDGTAEVNAAHSLYKDVESGTLAHGRQTHLAFVHAAVELTDVFTVNKYLCIVVGIKLEHATFGKRGERGAVKDAAESLIVLLHGFHLLVRHRRRQIGHKRSHFGKSEFVNRGHRILGRHLGQFLAAVSILLQGFAERHVLGCIVAGLTDWGIIVVAGHVGSESWRVGTGPVSPVGSAVGHIEAERDAFRQHLFDAGNHVGGWTGLMVGAPFVKPSAPELGAHQRGIGAQLLQTGELLVDIGARTEIHGPDQVVQTVEGEIAGPVALEHLHILAEIAAEHVAYGCHILLVLAIRAIFVLDLHHDDRAAVLCSESFHLLGHLLLEEVDAFKEIGVAFAQTDVLFLQQPPGESAHFPFGAHIGAGAQNHVHAVVAAQTHKFTEIVLSGEIEFARLRLMRVPEHIEAHGVHAQCLGLLDALVPVGTRNAGVVKLGSLHHVRLAVEQECALSGFKCYRGIFRQFIRRMCGKRECEHRRSERQTLHRLDYTRFFHGMELLGK